MARGSGGRRRQRPITDPVLPFPSHLWLGDGEEAGVVGIGFATCPKSYTRLIERASR